MYRKSQTATEYLILLAVVIVIALIVISVLGGIPSIGGGASSSASEARLKSLGIGVENYAFSNESGIITVKNNKPDSVSVTAVYVDGKECGYGSFALRAGQSRKINCSNITNSGSKFDYSISMNWTDTNSGARYVQDDSDLKISGDVVLGLNTDVGSVGSSGGSGGGSSYVPTYLLTFASPTPSDSSTYSGTNVSVNVSIPDASQLESVVFDWNSANTTIYNGSVVMLSNFDSYTGMNDSSGNSANFSCGGDCPTSGVGKYGAGYVFDGSNDYLKVETATYDFAQLFATNNFAISYWFKTTTSTYSYMFGTYNSGNGIEGHISHGGNTGKVVVMNWDSPNNMALENTTNWADDTWHHFLFTRNSTYAAMYLDGNLADYNDSVTVGIGDSGRVFVFGCTDEGSPSHYFASTMDEFIVYDRFLSASEVSTLYASNLRKYDSDKWQLFVNKTSLSTASYEYQAFISMSDTGANSSARRSVTLS